MTEGAVDNGDSGKGSFKLPKPVRLQPAAVEARHRPQDLPCVNINGRDQDKNKESTNRRPGKRDSDSRRKRVEFSRKRRQSRVRVKRFVRGSSPRLPQSGIERSPGGRSVCES